MVLSFEFNKVTNYKIFTFHLTCDTINLWEVIYLKLFISRYDFDSGYFIQSDKKLFDEDVAFLLDLTVQKYRDILKSCGANLAEFEAEEESIFVSKKDAKRALKKLEPYLIMANLTE